MHGLADVVLSRDVVARLVLGGTTSRAVPLEIIVFYLGRLAVSVATDGLLVLLRDGLPFEEEPAVGGHPEVIAGVQGRRGGGGRMRGVVGLGASNARFDGAVDRLGRRGGRREDRGPRVGVTLVGERGKGLGGGEGRGSCLGWKVP